MFQKSIPSNFVIPIVSRCKMKKKISFWSWHDLNTDLTRESEYYLTFSITFTLLLLKLTNQNYPKKMLYKFR